MPLNGQDRQRFDELLEQVLAGLPADLRHRFDEIPLVVEDRPSKSMLRRLDIHRGEVLCGAHSGIPLTRRSVRHSGALPTVITIYREGIMLAASDQEGKICDEALGRQIRRTVLHELGHHFGLGEADLRSYGYA